jgi:hypothetical protein
MDPSSRADRWIVSIETGANENRLAFEALEFGGVHSDKSCGMVRVRGRQFLDGGRLRQCPMAG